MINQTSVKTPTLCLVATLRSSVSSHVGKQVNPKELFSWLAQINAIYESTEQDGEERTESLKQNADASHAQQRIRGLESAISSSSAYSDQHLEKRYQATRNELMKLKRDYTDLLHRKESEAAEELRKAVNSAVKELDKHCDKIEVKHEPVELGPIIGVLT